MITLFTPVRTLALLALFSACASGPRPYYSRLRGGYVRFNQKPAVMKPVRGGPGRVEGGRKDGGAIVQTARRYLGVPYRYGGNSRSGMDCSGLVKRVFAEALGIELPHSSRQVGQMGRHVSRKKLKPGDVVLFGSAFGINHSGIYTSQDKFIHASRKRGVVESSLNQTYWKKRWKTGRRLL